VYVAGDTTATAFPTVGPFQGTLGGKHDGFITKFGPGGSPMIFSTYLGGAGDDFINGIAVGGRAGNVYVTGDTDSTNFPTFIPFQSANRGGAEAFVSELNTAGNGLVFSSYFGGAGEDRGMSIALDADSNVFFTGFTASSGNFPLMLPVQPAFGGGPYDAFLTKFNAQGTQPLFSTFLGGDGDDEAFGVAADPVSGRAIVTGATASRNFFTTPDAAQGTSRGGADIFITQFTVDGNSRPYSTLLGGAGDDFGLGIAMGPNGVFGIAGATASSDFPTVASPARFGGGAVDLVALEGSLNGTPRFPIFSAVIGGSGADVGYGVSFDPTGNALFTGGTNSTDLTLVRAIQASNAGGNDVIIVGFNPAGVVQTESYFGGPGSDLGIAAVFDPRTSVFLLSGISTTPQNQQKGFLAIYNELFPPLPPGPLRK
jgi:hypothetical protein